MADYTKIIGKGKAIARRVAPSGAGKDSTLHLLKHSATLGYEISIEVTSGWNAKTDEESGVVKVWVEENETVTAALLGKAAALAINGYVFKFQPLNGKRPPISPARRIWFFAVNGTADTVPIP